MRSFYQRNRSTAWLVIFFIVILYILSSFRRKRGLKKASKADSGLFKFDSYTREIQVRNLNGDVILNGKLGLHIGSSYYRPEENTKDGLHYTWDGHILLRIVRGDKNCITVDWDSVLPDEIYTPTDCFNLGNSYWYGGGQLNMPSWPLNRANVQMSPFYAKVYKHVGNQHFTSVLEPYWLSSSGVAIYVDEIVPLHVSINENGSGRLCLRADTDGYPGFLKPVHLKYRMCFGNNLKLTHQLVASKYFDKPTESLSSSMTRYPICSMNSPNQAKLTRFFRSIVIRQFSCSHIDLGLQQGLDFNKQDFPNPKNLVRDIQSRKLKVSVSVDSVFNSKQQDVPEEYLINNYQTNALDLTHSKVRNWFTENVLKFQKKFDIDTIRFCCGDLEFPIAMYKLNRGQNPGIYVQNYAKVASTVSKSTDIRVGYKTQALPMVVAIADRSPNWGKEMGLRSIIPMVLSIGIVGYPFLTIGPIGGKANGITSVNKELYIRWMQLSVFFPVMEFMTYPWEYDDSDTVQASADILDTRYMLWDNILTIAKESVKTGAPIVRPMWWIAPNDPVTYHLAAQFMLGDIYLVAPVLWPGVTKHEVYLPKGVWREMFGKGEKHEVEVGQWMNIKVNLKTVVYFECLICKS